MLSGEQALLDRWVHERDAEAFKQLAERYASMVFATCMRLLRNAADAEEVAQECFETLSTHAKGPRGPVGPWLHRVATNKALNRITLEKRRRDRDLRYIEQRETSVKSEWEDLYPHVDEAIAKLPDDQRRAVVAHFLEGETHDAIAVREGVSRVAVTRRTQRGIEGIRKYLHRKGVVTTSSVLAALMAGQMAEAAPPTLLAAIGKIALAGVPMQTGGMAAGAVQAIGGLGLAKTAALGTAAAVLIAAAVALIRPEVQSTQLSQGAASNTGGAQQSGTVPLQSEARPPSDTTPVEGARSTNVLVNANDGRPGTIRGIVLSPDGDPAPGATVTLHRSFGNGKWLTRRTGQWRTATTDDEGNFEFVNAGYYDPVKKRVSADFEILARTSQAFAKGRAFIDEEEPEDYAILRLAPAALLAGVVVDKSGNPISGAEIYPAKHKEGERIPYYVAPAMAAISDGSGAFHFPALWRGEWSFEVRAEGYAAQTTDFFPAGVGGARIVLGSEVVAKGQVLENESGDPVAGIEVMLGSDRQCENRIATTDAEGRFRFDGLGDGKYGLLIRDVRWAPLEGVSHFDVYLGRIWKSLDLPVTEGAVVAGRIYDAETGLGVEGADVIANDPEASFGRQSEKTGPDGHYRITGLMSGSYTLNRSRFLKGYPFPNENHFEPTLTLATGQVAEGHDFPLERGLSVTGKVVDTEGRPLAKVSLWGKSPSHDDEYRKSAPDGAFELLGFAAGEEFSFVKIELDGYAPRPFEKVAIPEGGLRDLVLVMEAQGIAEGIIVDASGAPQPNASIIFQSASSDISIIPTTTTRADGRFTLSRLAAGDYAVSLRASGQNGKYFAVGHAALHAGEHKSGLRFVVQGDDSGASGKNAISGRVVDLEGHPVEGLKIQAEAFHDASGVHRTVTTSGNGAFQFEQLEPRRYQLFAEDSAYSEIGIGYFSAGSKGVVLVVEKVEAGARGDVEVRVVNAKNSAPITEFDYLLAARTAFTKVQDVEGKLTIPGVTGGHTWITVRRVGFADFTGVVGSLGAKVTEIRLDPGTRVAGRVVNAAGAPLAGATVYLGPRDVYGGNKLRLETQADEGGAFVLDGLSSAGGYLSAEYEGYVPLSVMLEPQGRSEIQPIITLDTGGIVEGQIRMNGQPAPGALFWVNVAMDEGNYYYSGSAGGDGAFRISGVRTGMALAGARLSGKGMERDANTFHLQREITVTTAQSTAVDFDFDEPSGSIDGVVTMDGEPWDAHLELAVENDAGTLRMEADARMDGIFAFSYVPEGEATLKAVARGSEAGEVTRFRVSTFTMAVGEGKKIQVELGGGGDLRVRVGGAQPNERVRVEAHAGRVEPIRDRAAEEAMFLQVSGYGRETAPGEFLLSNLAPGPHTLSVIADQDDLGNSWLKPRFASTTVTLESGTETTVDVVLGE